ncbi:MAG: hypothetical protein U0263_36845 [Polyangiaceae bacterium]
MSALKPCEKELAQLDCHPLPLPEQAHGCTSTESHRLADRIVTNSMSYSCHVLVEAERKDVQVTDPNAEPPSPEAREFTECTIRWGR